MSSKAASVSWASLSAAIQMNPQRTCNLVGGAGSGKSNASASVGAMPDVESIPWLDGSWSEDTTFTVADVVALVLWIRDPLYRVAVPSLRRAMEMEEAASLLHGSEAAWRADGGAGRTRGWVRKHLEEDLRARASGGDPNPNAWDTVRTVKRAAQLVDYICYVRGLRFGLWWPDSKTVTMIPLSSPSTVSVVNLNCLSGRVLVGANGFSMPGSSWPAMLSNGMTWIPPACAPSIGAQTVASIHEALIAVQPNALKTGNRAALWNRLLWARLEKGLVSPALSLPEIQA